MPCLLDGRDMMSKCRTERHVIGMARLYGYHGDSGQSERRFWKYGAILVRGQRLLFQCRLCRLQR